MIDRLLKKIIKEENDQIEAELYNNQLQSYVGDEDKKPVVLVDFK